MSDAALLRRAGDLKGELVAFSQQPRYDHRPHPARDNTRATRGSRNATSDQHEHAGQA